MTSNPSSTRPFLVLVDDDPAVLGAIERDMRSRYGKDYSVLCTDSGSAALQLVKDLKRRGSEVALFLVDQRMPAMTGLEFLTEARDIYPVARRVLLTAFSDTSV